MGAHVLLLPGDGIGPEVVAEAERVLLTLNEIRDLDLQIEHGLFGGAAIDAGGGALPADTLARAAECDAVLLGAVGGRQWDKLPDGERPENGLLRLRAELRTFANLRPVTVHTPLLASSALKEERVRGVDIMIVRELTGGIYFGEPRGRRVRKTADGPRSEAFNTMVYSEDEVRRVARHAFDLAMRRDKRLCSVDKANVLEVMAMWRAMVEEVAADYPEVELTHQYVDNAAMQLMLAPKQFDVIVTANLFGDILSDLAATLGGSIGMLPSASLNESGRGIYEPCHGSAPDLAGRDCANPLAAILSAAMLLRHSLALEREARAVEAAVDSALEQGLRTPDIHIAGEGRRVGTRVMGEAVLAALEKQRR